MALPTSATAPTDPEADIPLRRALEKAAEDESDPELCGWLRRMLAGDAEGTLSKCSGRVA
ncbi:MAG TPA: hypothetical protein VKE74_13075 [Gemmataceae bacterium]|nr:hypothetical protein [Gemmataceae bacterium]